MKKLLLVALLALPAAALANDPGEQLFAQACASCHTARSPEVPAPPPDPNNPGPTTGPNLGEVVRNKDAAALRAWIAAPHLVRPGTGCDTRLVKPQQVDVLLSYLVTASLAPLPPKAELLRQQLDSHMSAPRRPPPPPPEPAPTP